MTTTWTSPYNTEVFSVSFQYSDKSIWYHSRVHGCFIQPLRYLGFCGRRRWAHSQVHNDCTGIVFVILQLMGEFYFTVATKISCKDYVMLPPCRLTLWWNHVWSSREPLALFFQVALKERKVVISPHTDTPVEESNGGQWEAHFSPPMWPGN